MPGTGFPVVINSTMCAKEVGYGAAGSLAVAGAGMMPPAPSPSEVAGAEDVSEAAVAPFVA